MLALCTVLALIAGPTFVTVGLWEYFYPYKKRGV